MAIYVNQTRNISKPYSKCKQCSETVITQYFERKIPRPHLEPPLHSSDKQYQELCIILWCRCLGLEVSAFYMFQWYACDFFFLYCFQGWGHSPLKKKGGGWANTLCPDGREVHAVFFSLCTLPWSDLFVQHWFLDDPFMQLNNYLLYVIYCSILIKHTGEWFC